MDYDDYKDPDEDLRFLIPVPPVTRSRKKGDATRPEISHAAQRMYAWEQQRERQLGFKWARNFKAEVLQSAADAVNTRLAETQSSFSVSVIREGSGIVMLLNEKGSPAPVARSKPVVPARITTETAERIVTEFCAMHGRISDR